MQLSLIYYFNLIWLWRKDFGTRHLGIGTGVIHVLFLRKIRPSRGVVVAPTTTATNGTFGKSRNKQTQI